MIKGSITLYEKKQPPVYSIPHNNNIDNDWYDYASMDNRNSDYNNGWKATDGQIAERIDTAIESALNHGYKIGTKVVRKLGQSNQGTITAFVRDKARAYSYYTGKANVLLVLWDNWTSPSVYNADELLIKE